MKVPVYDAVPVLGGHYTDGYSGAEGSRDESAAAVQSFTGDVDLTTLHANAARQAWGFPLQQSAQQQIAQQDWKFGVKLPALTAKDWAKTARGGFVLGGPTGYEGADDSALASFTGD